MASVNDVMQEIIKRYTKWRDGMGADLDEKAIAARFSETGMKSAAKNILGGALSGEAKVEKTVQAINQALKTDFHANEITEFFADRVQGNAPATPRAKEIEAALSQIDLDPKQANILMSGGVRKAMEVASPERAISGSPDTGPTPTSLASDTGTSGIRITDDQGEELGRLRAENDAYKQRVSKLEGKLEGKTGGVKLDAMKDARAKIATNPRARLREMRRQAKAAMEQGNLNLALSEAGGEVTLDKRQAAIGLDPADLENFQDRLSQAEQYMDDLSETSGELTPKAQREIDNLVVDLEEELSDLEAKRESLSRRSVAASDVASQHRATLEKESKTLIGEEARDAERATARTTAAQRADMEVALKSKRPDQLTDAERAYSESKLSRGKRLKSGMKATAKAEAIGARAAETAAKVEGALPASIGPTIGKLAGGATKMLSNPSVMATLALMLGVDAVKPLLGAKKAAYEMDITNRPQSTEQYLEQLRLQKEASGQADADAQRQQQLIMAISQMIAPPTTQFEKVIGANEAVQGMDLGSMLGTLGR